MDRGRTVRAAVIYTRVSSKEQLDGYSLDTQQKACRDYAARYGFFVDRVFEERAESAKTAKRTQLQLMVSYLQANKGRIAAVIIYKVDRLARDSGDYANLSKMIPRLGMELLSTMEPLSDTPSGHFTGNIAAASAQYDNEQRGDNCRRGMLAAFAEGRYVWLAPLGYRNSMSKAEPSLVLGDPDTVALVRMSFELVDAGSKVREALKIVTRRGLRTRRGRRLNRSSFYTMLSHRVYIGMIDGFGRSVQGDFAPIIPQDLFYRVQAKLHQTPASNAVTYQKDNPKFPLRGLAVCPVCGHVLTASESSGNGGKYGYYSCAHCKKTRIPKEKLEADFAAELSRVSLKREYVDALDAPIDDQMQEQRSFRSHETARIQRQLAELDAKRDGIVNKNIEGIIPDEVAKKLLAKTVDDEETLKIDLATVSAPRLENPELLKTAIAILADLRTYWESQDLCGKQKIQAFVFPERIIADKSGIRTKRIASILEPRQTSTVAQKKVVGPPGFEPRTKWL